MFVYPAQCPLLNFARRALANYSWIVHCIVNPLYMLHSDGTMAKWLTCWLFTCVHWFWIPGSSSVIIISRSLQCPSKWIIRRRFTDRIVAPNITRHFRETNASSNPGTCTNQMITSSNHEQAVTIGAFKNRSYITLRLYQNTCCHRHLVTRWLFTGIKGKQS